MEKRTPKTPSPADRYIELLNAICDLVSTQEEDSEEDSEEDREPLAVSKNSTLDYERANKVLKSRNEVTKLAGEIVYLCQDDGRPFRDAETLYWYLMASIEFHKIEFIQAWDLARLYEDILTHGGPNEGFVTFGLDDIRLLEDKMAAAQNLMNHTMIWRNEVINAVRDLGASNISKLFSPDKAADCLGIITRHKTARQQAAQANEQAKTYYGSRQTREEFLACYGPLQIAEEFHPNEETWADFLERKAASHWCPVTKLFVNPCFMKVAHIVPVSTSETVIRDWFGDFNAKALLGSGRNLLFMHEGIVKAFNEGWITFVPVESTLKGGNNQPTEFRIFFLNRAILVENKRAVELPDRTWITWGDIAKSPQLKFRNKSRPGLRNLFYHCVTSFIRATKHACFHPFDPTAALTEFKEWTVWNEPGPWIKDGILKRMSEMFMMPLYRSLDTTLVKDEELKELEREVSVLGTFDALVREKEEHIYDETDCDYEEWREDSSEVDEDWDEDKEDSRNDFWLRMRSWVRVKGDPLAEVVHPYFAPKDYFSPQALLPFPRGWSTHWITKIRDPSSGEHLLPKSLTVGLRSLLDD